MELHLFVLRESKNIFLTRYFSARQRTAVMAFIPDRSCCTTHAEKTNVLKKKITETCNQPSLAYMELNGIG